MGKRKIKISESQYRRIFKQSLNEAGGYDDMGIMALHGSATQGILQRVVGDITKILDSTTNAFDKNMKKVDIMNGISTVSDVLNNIKDALSKIGPELVNDDLREAANDLEGVIRRSEKKLRLLSNKTHSSAHPDMPPAMTGLGFSMDDSDFNDFFTKIILDLGNSAERLAFQVKDEVKILTKRFRGGSPDDDYGNN